MIRLREVGERRDEVDRCGVPSASRRSDRGAGSVLALGVVAAAVLVTASVLPALLAAPARHRLVAAADAAALAAADTASGRSPGVPCEQASRLAAAHAARLEACRVDGLVAEVVVVGEVLGVAVSAVSAAGPPSSGAP